MNREEQINNANPYDGSNHIYYAAMSGFKMGAHWADKHPISPWISVEEQLPEPHTNVFFIVRYADHVSYCTGFFHSPVKWESENRTFFSNSPYYNITHWMKIPFVSESVKCDKNTLDGEEY